MEVVRLNARTGSIRAAIVNPRRQQNMNWKKGKFYENNMLEYIQRNYSGGVFVDCGACIGNHTLFFAAFCKPVRVIAIEPDVNNAKHIEKNVSINKFKHVQVINAAVSDYNGRGAMEKFGKGEGHQKLVWGDSVDVITLDSLELQNVTLIKLDVEWSEPQALVGAHNILSAQHAALFVEANTKSEQQQIKKYLKQFGYRHKSTFNASPTLEFVK